MWEGGGCGGGCWVRRRQRDDQEQSACGWRQHHNLLHWIATLQHCNTAAQQLAHTGMQHRNATLQHCNTATLLAFPSPPHPAAGHARPRLLGQPERFCAAGPDAGGGAGSRRGAADCRPGGRCRGAALARPGARPHAAVVLAQRGAAPGADACAPLQRPGAARGRPGGAGAAAGAGAGGVGGAARPLPVCQRDAGAAVGVGAAARGRRHGAAVAVLPRLRVPAHPGERAAGGAGPVPGGCWVGWVGGLLCSAWLVSTVCPACHSC